ncbi:MAG: hypothetical protein AB8F95_21825 [Bacteroidia bacterium]
MLNKDKYRMGFMTILVIGLLLGIAGCGNSRNPESELTEVFEILEERIIEDSLEEFKTAPIDSIGSVLNLVYYDAEKVFFDLPQESKLGIHLDTIFEDHHRKKIEYLTIAFHLYCNEKKINIEEITWAQRAMYRYELLKSDDIKNKKLYKIAEANDSMFMIGDTITVYLPYRDESGRITTYYYTSHMPKYPKGVDSLGVTGIILHKGFNDLYFGGKDSTSIVFKIKVLKMDQEEAVIASESIKRGDTASLHVTGYGRIIQK